MTQPLRTLDRRQLLLGAGATLVAAACSSSSDSGTATTTSSTSTSTTTAASGAATTTSASAASTVAEANAAAGLTELTAAQFDALGSCDLLLESTAGPFPLDEQFLRTDVTESYPGHSVRLGMRLVDADCAPITGAEIEIWHADASGDYSAFIDDGGGKDEGEGTTFLRGTQPVNDRGIAEFTTIYPGHYPGRPPHIHLRVRQDGGVRFTTQLFFEDAFSETIYSDGAYAEFGTDFTPNAEDSIGAAAPANLYADTLLGPGTLALANLAIR